MKTLAEFGNKSLIEVAIPGVAFEDGQRRCVKRSSGGGAATAFDSSNAAHAWNDAGDGWVGEAEAKRDFGQGTWNVL